MADRGVSFAGEGGKDVGDSMPRALPTGSLGAGGPVDGPPDTNKGMSADAPTNPKGGNVVGMPEKGGPVDFAGDVGK